MHRPLATAIYTYAGLAAAQWGHANLLIHTPPKEGLLCGNAIVDPLAALINVGASLAALCTVALVYRCIKDRRWSCYAVAALLIFVVTSACLAYEAHDLDRYGLELGRVWWLPWP